MPTSTRKVSSKKAMPAMAAQHVSRSSHRPSIFVPVVSALAIVFAFISVLLAFNTVTGSFMQHGTSQRLDDLQAQIDALRDQASARPAANGVILRPLSTSTSASGAPSSTH